MTSPDSNIGQSLYRLEKTLGEIYPEDSDSRRFADYVNLPLYKVDFQGTPINIWHSLLSFAKIRGVMEMLIELCLEDSQSIELKKAYESYRATLEVEHQNQRAARGDDDQEPAYAEKITCTISISEKLSIASHEYTFALKNFGLKLGEDKFQWLVPNASPDSVTSVAANFGGEKHPFTKEALGRGTKLVFDNLQTTEREKLTTLRFSYEAPTSAYFYSGDQLKVCFYHAQLFHDFEITKLEEVTIKLPGEAVISMPDTTAVIKGPTISYQEYNVLRGELRVFPVFFSLAIK